MNQSSTTSEKQEKPSKRNLTLFTETLMVNKNKSTKLNNQLNHKENKETRSKLTLNNIKRSSTQQMKKFKIATKLKMKPEKHITKHNTCLLCKTIKSFGLEGSETKRKLLNLNLQIDKKELTRKDKRSRTQQTQMKSRLRHVIILSSIAISLRKMLDLFHNHQKRLHKLFKTSSKMIT